MVVVVDTPPEVKPTPPPASVYSQPSTIRSESPRPRSGLFQNIISGRSSPFNGLPATASSFLRRSSSTRSINGDGNGKRNSMMKLDGAAKDTAMPGTTPMLAASTSSGQVATSSIPASPVFPSQTGSLHAPSDPPRVVTEQIQPPKPATSGASSSTITSSISASSVDKMDEDIVSTRSSSPWEDMATSQIAPSTTSSSPREDLPESLRLMRVAQRRGVKVLDFAFEGPKREGVVEDWAWEGGAACKGFGIGIGGGAYNGPLKKYKPPPKESPPTPEDAVVIDSPSPSPSIFTRSPNRPKPLSLSDSSRKQVERPLNSPPPPSRPGTTALSQSGFLQYLQQRQVQAFSDLYDPENTEASAIKRQSPFVSTEHDSNHPCKKRSIS